MPRVKFDYKVVTDVYNEMKNITVGNDSIQTVLDDINTQMRNGVNVPEEAVYGELGKQLLLDWDNTSSNFPNFVNNFQNWSALIAQAAGNYSTFEQDIAGFKQEHMLGATSEAGRTTAYTNDGYYSTYTQDLVDTAALYVGDFKAYNGIGYFDTNMVALEEQRKTNAKWAFGIQTVSVVLSVIGLKGLGKVGTTALSSASDDIAGAAVNVVSETADDAASAALRTAAGSVDDLAAAASNNIDDLIAGLAGKTTKEQAAYITKLVEDGVINSEDDLLRLFGGNIGSAKTVMGGGSAYRAFVKTMFNSADDAAAAAASAAVGTLDDAAGAAVRTAASGADDAVGAVVNNPSLKTKILSMSDDALAKALGLSDEMVQSLTLDGATVRDYALANLGDTKVISALSSAGTKAVNGASSLLSAAKVNINTMSNSALAKALGLSDEMVQSLALDGVTVRQYAMGLLGDSKVVQTLASIGSNGYVPSALGAGTSFFGENLLKDVDFNYVSYTDNPYATLGGE